MQVLQLVAHALPLVDQFRAKCPQLLEFALPRVGVDEGLGLFVVRRHRDDAGVDLVGLLQSPEVPGVAPDLLRVHQADRLPLFPAGVQERPLVATGGLAAEHCGRVSGPDPAD